MRKLFALLPVLLLLSFTTANDPLSKKDKKFAVSYLKQTKKDLQDAVKNLSDAQLNWKPADSVWSVAECVEHIALAEKNLFDFGQSSLKETANPDKRKELKFATEQDVIKMITDRSFRVKTREGFIPSNQFGSAQKSLAACHPAKVDRNISICPCSIPLLRYVSLIFYKCKSLKQVLCFIGILVCVCVNASIYQ